MEVLLKRVESWRFGSLWPRPTCSIHVAARRPWTPCVHMRSRLLVLRGCLPGSAAVGVPCTSCPCACAGHHSGQGTPARGLECPYANETRLQRRSCPVPDVCPARLSAAPEFAASYGTRLIISLGVLPRRSTTWCCSCGRPLPSAAACWMRHRQLYVMRCCTRRHI